MNTVSKTNLVSIIIPVYNREHLIIETLSSISNQIFKNWECILVDDGSTDNSFMVMKEFVKSDIRFKLYKRSDEFLEGGNGARNYGFSLTKGRYIIWFDSDDIMHNNYLADKILKFEEQQCDFIVSKSQSWYPETNEYVQNNYSGNFNQSLSQDQFLRQKVFWITFDFMCKKELLLNVTWNESLRSGQDYNFFVRFFGANYNSKGYFLDKTIVDYRRSHQSIQYHISNDSISYRKQKFEMFFKTYLDVKDLYELSSSEYLLQRSLAFYPNNTFTPKVYKEVVDQFGKLALLLFVAYVSIYKLTGKGHYIYTLLKKRIETI